MPYLKAPEIDYLAVKLIIWCYLICTDTAQLTGLCHLAFFEMRPPLSGIETPSFGSAAEDRNQYTAAYTEGSMQQ